jgi:rubrerythrin
MITKELEIIRQAILNETEGYDFYAMAAAKSGAGEAGEAFRQLASEELKHIDWLKDLYLELKKDSSGSFEWTSMEEPPDSPEIFSWKNAGLEKGSLAVSVLGIGIQLERAAIEFYEKAGRETTIPAAKKLFDVLIKWEYQHLSQFQQDYDMLREEWWERQGFSPS